MAQRRKIGIIGAGFSGTALAAQLGRLTKHPIDIILCDKTGEFGQGDAYKTPYPFHLLNVRAESMSAFEDDQAHFVTWLQENYSSSTFLETSCDVAKQFVPRMLYKKYLHSLLQTLQLNSLINITYVPHLIQSIMQDKNRITLKSAQEDIRVDEVVFAIGNNPPTPFPFLLSQTNAITNPWDYNAPKNISADEDVLISGYGT